MEADMGLEGTWTNELGSTFVVGPVTGGGFEGTYTTAVSNEHCAQGEFVVAGRTDTDSGGQSVAWVVAWKNEPSGPSDCHSATAWAGQYEPGDEPGSERITAFWLLSYETPPSGDWAATNIGVDTFTRSPAGPVADTPLVARGPSHP
jgi:hypothetical protein